MAAPPDGGPPPRDLIGIFVRHPTAANLLMVAMILVGVFALLRMNTQFFPDFGIDVVTVEVEWPGASAEDVDANIVEAIEPEIRFLDGVKRVRSAATESFGRIYIEFEPGADMQLGLSNVETAVGQVTTLPEDSERPIVRRIVRYEPISKVVVSGQYSEASLKAIAKRMRDDLLARGVDKVTLGGARAEEIWVEIPQARLLELDMTLNDVAERVRETSQDIPSGGTMGAHRKQVRSIGLEKDANGISRIEIKSLPTGQRVRLGDVARTTEQFDEDQAESRRRGERAIDLQIQRSLHSDALQLAAIVDRYLAETLPTLPPELKVVQYNVQAELIRSRIELLLVNGASGLVLVVLVLFIFLSSPVAFWVAMGIPVAFMATLGVMLVSGQTINMISLFGMIMALGIVVDDAIVVGEHADALRRRGLAAPVAAELGARHMGAPVFSSSLTTIAAFLPLLVISDVIGDIIVAIPFVVISILVASLIECFLVLPGHLRGALAGGSGRVWPLREWFNGRFDGFRDGTFRRLVAFAVEWRYATLAGGVAMLILSVGLVGGGRVPFNFFPSPEADLVYGNVKMVAGTPRAQTETMIRAMEQALDEAERALTGGKGRVVRMAVDTVGASVGRGDTGQSASGDDVAGIVVELMPSDERDIRTADFVNAWRKAVVPIAGLETMTILAAQGGPPGRALDLRLAGGDVAVLKEAAAEVKALLSRYPGVTDVEDNLAFGKEEVVLELTPQGNALGFTTDSVGRQMRNALEGAIARRFARGDEEVKIRVRYPQEHTDGAMLHDTYLRAPAGAEVPLTEVVSLREKQGFAQIRREDGQREVAITGEIDRAVTTGNKVIEALQRDGVAGIAAKHGLRLSFKGKAEEEAQTMGDMKVGGAFALMAIYVILAWVFGSYARPLVVMSIIPLSFVGATFGHWLLGYDLTILSMIAMVGLAGIVVNDSIILVTTIDERIRGGEHFMDAVVNGTCDRLRAVILTSLTTIGGLAPLLFETSLQAQFLIPMAVTLVFGLMATTVLVLLLIPSLIAVQGDVGYRVRRRRSARPAAVAE
jgi:multidrug efflux pump subunit AcrB